MIQFRRSLHRQIRRRFWLREVHRACYLDTAGLSDRPPQWKASGYQEEKRRQKKVEKRTKRKNFLSSFLAFLVMAVMLIGSISQAVLADDYEAGKTGTYHADGSGDRRGRNSKTDSKCEPDPL